MKKIVRLQASQAEEAGAGAERRGGGALSAVGGGRWWLVKGRAREAQEWPGDVSVARGSGTGCGGREAVEDGAGRQEAGAMAMACVLE